MIMRGVLGFSKLIGKSSVPDGTDNEVGLRPLDASDLSASGVAPENAPSPPPAHLSRTQRLRINLEGALDQVQHARSEAEHMAEMLADYEAKARMLETLTARNEELARGVEDERFKSADLAAKNSELSREVARMLEDVKHAQGAVEETQAEVSSLTLARQRDADRMITLSSQISGLKANLVTAHEAKERAEVEGSGLRAALVERDHALSALHSKEAEWRLRAEKDASQMADLEHAGERKERRIAELTGAIEKEAKRIEELEERGDRALEEQRQLEIRYNDLNVSSESRLFTLSGALEQEQAGHRVTRKLLEEMRIQTQSIADENKQLKDQAVKLAQENQQMKHELGGTRGTIREYGERLSELNLRYSAAQDDIERLEASITDTKKETRRLNRRANKVDDLLSENASLHEKIKSLQQTVEHYRAAGPRALEAPIALPQRRSHQKGATARTEAAPIVKLPKAT